MSRAEPHGLPVSGRGGAWPGAVSLRWRVGSEAARRAFGVGGAGVRLELRLVDRGGGRWARELLLVTGDGERALRRGECPVRWNRDEGRGLLHVDADGLAATFEIGEGSTRVLYARSPLLGELGLLGGRYEVDAAEVEWGG